MECVWPTFSHLQGHQAAVTAMGSFKWARHHQTIGQRSDRAATGRCLSKSWIAAWRRLVWSNRVVTGWRLHSSQAVSRGASLGNRPDAVEIEQTPITVWNGAIVQALLGTRAAAATNWPKSDNFILLKKLLNSFFLHSCRSAAVLPLANAQRLRNTIFREKKIADYKHYYLFGWQRKYVCERPKCFSRLVWLLLFCYSGHYERLFD